MKLKKLLFTMGAALFLAGCNGEALPDTAVIATPGITLPIATSTPTATPTNTPTPTPTPLYLKNAGLSGLSVYDIDPSSNEIQMFAQTDWDLSSNEYKYTTPEIINGMDKSLYFATTRYVEIPDGEYIKTANRRFLLTKLDFSDNDITYEPISDFDGKDYALISNVNNDFFWVTLSANFDENFEKNYCCVDYNGNLISNSELDLSDKYYSTGFAPGFLYYGDFEKHSINELNIDTNTSRELPTNNNLTLKYFTQASIFNDRVYCIGTFLGSDLAEYTAIIDIETGEPLYCFPSEDSIYLSFLNNIIIINDWGNEKTHFIHNDKKFSFSVDDAYLSYNFLDEDTVLLASHNCVYEEVTYSDESGDSWTYDELISEKLHLSIFDFNQGKVIASSDFDPELFSDINNAKKISDNTLIFSSILQSGSAYYYYWNFENSTTNTDSRLSIEIENYHAFNNQIPSGQWTRDKLVSSDLDARYTNIKTMATELENKYNVTIKFANEANCIMGGYVISGETDTELLTKALNDLEKALKMYPTGFFNSFKDVDTYKNGLSIYLSNKILGTNDNLYLTSAAGLTNTENSGIQIILDIDDVIDSTLHHEMSHAIDNLLEAKGYEFYYDSWNNLNVSYSGVDADFYSCSYVNYNDNHSYDNYILYYTSKNNKVIFIDHYSTTYPTEDRARLFEKHMTKSLNFDDYPGLKMKINAFLLKIKNVLGYEF